MQVIARYRTTVWYFYVLLQYPEIVIRTTRLEDKFSVKGEYLLLNVPELAPGLYIYKLVADGKVLATDKMLILNNAAYE